VSQTGAPQPLERFDIGLVDFFNSGRDQLIRRSLANAPRFWLVHSALETF
jgi:hypothetical protein